MHEALALKTLPQTLESLASEIRERRRLVWDLDCEAAKFVACLISPFVWDGEKVTRLRDIADDIPPALLDLIRMEKTDLAVLEAEYYTRRQAGER